MELDAVIPLVEENVELFRIFWPPDPNLVQARAGICMVVMVRRAAGGGLLVALPSALVPAGSLPVEPMETDVIGPHTHLEVPGVRMTNSATEALGIDLGLHVVDLGQPALQAITPLALLPESEDQGLIGFGEDLDIIPDPFVLVEMVREWLGSHASNLVAFYSAEEGEVIEDDEVHALPLPARTGQARTMTPDTPKAKPKEPAKKRVTTAVLSEQLSSLMDLIPSMTNQISDLQKGQLELQESLAIQKASLTAAVQGAANFAKMVGPPPRTKQLPQPSPTLAIPNSGLDANLSRQELAEETSPVAHADPFARAMLEQSKAIMSLVAHMQQGGDPLLDGQASSSSMGRGKLQKDLASKSGGFYLAVLQNAVKRLRPAHPRPSSVEEVASTDFSMIQYLERFGGYGQFKELGLIQYALAHIFDALAHSDLNGARDYLALLMVGVDQANLDGNRWELAYRMMLLEEPPSQLWSYRNQSFDPRAKSFSALAPQNWTTVALAYSKEMDYIQTKRLEVTQPKGGQASNQQQGQNTQLKKKGRFPKAKATSSQEHAAS